MIRRSASTPLATCALLALPGAVPVFAEHYRQFLNIPYASAILPDVASREM